MVVFEGLGLSDAEAHSALYVLLSVLSMSSTAFLLKVRESKVGLKKGSLREMVSLKSKGILARHTLAGAIIAFGAGLVVPLMARWFYLQYGIPDSLSGPIIGVSDILIGIATLAAPRTARGFGTVKAIVLTQGLSTIFMFGTPLPKLRHCMRCLYHKMLHDVYVFTPSQSMLMGVVPNEERGGGLKHNRSTLAPPRLLRFSRRRLDVRAGAALHAVLCSRGPLHSVHRPLLEVLRQDLSPWRGRAALAAGYRREE
ncbi:MAG: hypothetical protein WHS82_06895 [Candidatus Methanosuratincola sp.]